jgi:hypothetical protein
MAVVLDLSENVEVRLALSFPFVEPHHGPIEATFRELPPLTSIHGDCDYAPELSRTLDDGSHPMFATDRQYDDAPKEPGDERARVNLRPGATLPKFAGPIVDLVHDPGRYGFKPGEPIRFWGLAPGAAQIRGHALFELLRVA